MQNFDIARDALETSLNSSGSAMREHEKWQRSLEAQINKLKASWQSLSQSFLKSDFLKGALGAVIGLADGLSKLIDTFGALPTILSAVAAGFSLFKNKGFFTFDKDSNSIKLFGTQLTGLKDKYTQIQTAISRYNSLSSKSASFQASYNNVLQNSSTSLGKYLRGLNGAKGSVGGYIASLIGAKAATIGLQVATTALNAALTMGISMIVSWAIDGIMKLVNAKKELSEKVEELTSKFEEQHSELKKLQGDYDTSNESSMISKYEKLSKGVDKLGRNISLTSDEYSEYQGIVSKIAEQFPSLVTGYDEQGNAILSCKDNVEALVEAYEKLIHTQNNEILTNAGDIEKDYANKLKDSEKGSFLGLGKKISTPSIELLEKVLNGDYSEKEIKKLLKGLNVGQRDGVYEALHAAGIGDMGALYGTGELAKAIYNQLQEDRSKIKAVIDDHYSQFDADVEKQKAMARAKLSDAFDVSSAISGLDYGNISEELQAVAYQIVNGLDKDFFDKLSKDGTSVEDWVTDLLDQFNKIGDESTYVVETALELDTKFNGGEISYGEYVDGINNISSLIDDWDVDEEYKTKIKKALSIEVDADAKANYKKMRQYLHEQLPTNDYWLDMVSIESDIDAFLKGLTADELQAVVDIRTEIDWGRTSAEDIRKQIEDRVKLSEALNFSVDFEIDTTALQALNEILAESASACGLTTESIDSLKSKYGELENYNPSTLFEATANGVKVNRDELIKLEKEYQDLKKADVQKHLDTLVNEYNDVTKEIDKCTNAHERAELIAKRETYKDKIEELAEYQSQLEGVTGAYQKWIDAQSAPEDYEGYESIATGREDIQDELSRGLLSNKGKAYIDLLSGEDLEGKSVDKYVEAWKKLDEKVGNTNYSINDFFTVNDDGDITSTGINRFFDGIQKDFKDKVYKLNEDTGEWYYDFSQENLQMIQDEWGMGIDAIELMLEAAAAAGYDIDWGGILDNLDLDTSSFETLISAAETAQEEFNKLKDVEDVDFNFTATGVEEATTEVEKARDVYLDLITNDDGSINLEAKGADKMRTMLATLLIQKQQLEDSKIVMSIDTSQLDKSQEDVGKAINAVIQFREKYKNLEIAVSTGQGIDEAKTELTNAMKDLQSLGGEGVDIAAQLIMGEGSNASALKSAVDESIKAIGQPNIKVGAELDSTIFGHLNSQLKQNFTPEATVKITGIDDSVVNQYTSTEKTADGKVKWTNDDSLVVEYASTEKTATGTVKWGNDTVDVRKSFSANGTVKWTSGNKVKVDVISEANGTANVNGTTGRAYKQGSWGIKGSGTALVGELGMETLVRGGHFYTIGDRGAEFIKYRQGDIIFNHKQTEELFKNGKVTSDGGRGKMFANGSAFADGSYWSAFGSDSGSGSLKQLAKSLGETVKKVSESAKKAVEKTANAVKNVSSKKPNISAKVTGTGAASALQELEKTEKGKADKDKFEETIDFVEIALKRIEREIDNLDQKANNVYASWSSRNKALADEIVKVGDEIDKQNQAYNRYIKEANSVGLSETWAKRVRDGTIDIYDENDFSEETAEKIKEYKEW